MSDQVALRTARIPYAISQRSGPETTIFSNSFSAPIARFSAQSPQTAVRAIWRIAEVSTTATSPSSRRRWMMKRNSG
jgi:hypothetical protein